MGVVEIRYGLYFIVKMVSLVFDGEKWIQKVRRLLCLTVILFHDRLLVLVI